MTAKRRVEQEFIELEVIIERTTQSLYFVQTDEESMFLNSPIQLPKSQVNIIKVVGSSPPITTITIPEWLAVDRGLV